jgi:endo-1,4-beta-xylanase
MKRYKGKIATWDVVNEPLAGQELFPSIFSNVMGEKYIDYAFQIAHETDPDCELFLNEAIGDYNGEKGKAFLKLLKRLVDRGVPIHGVGLQTHHISRIHNVEDLKIYMRKIGEMGLKVEVTELDIRLLHFKKFKDPYHAQGDQYYDIVKACIEEPACQGVTFWGITDGKNWMDETPPYKWKTPNAPYLLDEDLNKKPAFYGVWKALNEIKNK